MAAHDLRKMLKGISDKTGLPFPVVEKMFFSQFRFVRSAMAEGEKNKPETFKSVQVTHLGKFAIRKWKLKEFERLAKENGEE